MRVHYIQDEEKVIAYFPRTLRFFNINAKTREFIDALEAGLTKDKIITDLKISDEQYDTFNIKLQECLGTEDYLVDTYKSSYDHTLNNLSLNISNDCNLKCKYCYANGGVYHSPKQLMSIETAQRALDCFYNRFECINKISFFGGEPTQNLPVMSYVCEYVHNRNINKENKTFLGLMTNGTQITQELIELVNKYDIQVTISFDGTKEMQDIARVFPNGEGTSQVVLDNIKELQKYTSQPSAIEVTYHKQHEVNNVGIMDINRYIKENIGNVEIHLVPMGCKHNEPIEELDLENLDTFLDTVDEVLSEEGQGLSYTFVDRIMESLKEKLSSMYICDAAINSLSVTAKGNIYPCAVMVDRQSEWGGSVYDEDIFNSEQFKNMLNRYLEFNKKENAYCSQCFANTVCYGCLGMNAITKGTPFELDEKMCALNKKMLEKIIIKMNHVN